MLGFQSMTPRQAIAHWTNQATLARVLGVTPQVVNNWKRRSRIPLAQQIELHELSLGSLKVDRKRRANGD